MAKIGHFAKIAHKVPKSKYFYYLNRILIPDKFPFRRCIICLCYFNRSQMNSGREYERVRNTNQYFSDNSEISASFL